ncbi:MAG: hypothetical protein FWF71_06415 [Actinomycetia bacterium]|nr:hypothetical protein [Actinomycetes bacterium]
MQKYEVIREMFNPCGGEAPGKIDLLEIETEDIAQWLASRFSKEPASIEHLENRKGAIIYNVYIGVMRERYSFSAI